MTIVTDFAIASVPTSDLAKSLAAEAGLAAAKLALDKKAGTLRILSVARGEIFQLSPYSLKVRPGWNIRDVTTPANQEKIDQTARSIAKLGVLEPLTVTLEGEDAFVTNGHIRLLATFRAIETYGAAIKSIPVRQESRFASDADRDLAQIVRNDGTPLTVMEIGTGFVRLIRHGWTEDQIAEASGRTPGRVKQILDLMAGATPEIAAMVSSGQVSATTAADVIRAADGDGAKAADTLAAAVADAKAKGKAKATAKNVRAATAPAEPREPLEAPREPLADVAGTLRQIFEAATTQVSVESRWVEVSMLPEDWTTIQNLLGMRKVKKAA